MVGAGVGKYQLLVVRSFVGVGGGGYEGGEFGLVFEPVGEPGILPIKRLTL